jgi:hypothetical protein
MAYNTGEWVIEFRENTAAARLTAWVKPPQLKWVIRNSDEGGISCELPIGMEQYDGAPLRRDSIVPWHTDWYLYRGPNLRASGIVTSINLADERDTVMVQGMDWIGYLKHRIYPFDPLRYVDDHDWASFPVVWGFGEESGIDVKIIAEDIMEAMIEAQIGDPYNISAAFYTPPFILANRSTSSRGRYKIMAGDSSSIFDHLAKLQEISEGFEFDIIPSNLEFKIYAPDRDQGSPVYRFTKNTQLTALDWTNEGPLATVTLITGTGSSIRPGVVKTDFESIIRYRWTERYADVGNVAWQLGLGKTGDYEQIQDRFPRKRAAFAVLNPEFLTPNFWTGGRPRSLIGNRVRVRHDFFFHEVNADYTVEALNIEVDEHQNETVSFEAKMINTPESNPFFGGNGGGFEGA